MPEFPLVSFLTVNYKNSTLLKELYDSLNLIDSSNIEFIVVENGTVDSDLETFFESKNATYVATNQNLGFAGGNNFGLDYCKGDFIYFINNDTLLTESSLAPLIQLMQTDTKIGMISPRLHYWPKKNLVQYAGATDLSKYSLRNEGIGWMESLKEAYLKNSPTAFIHGAAMLVRKELIEEIGEMYEDYFLYYEEYDWCLRARKAGWKIWYCGESLVYHKESISTGQDSPLKAFYIHKNRMLFARRNLEGQRLLIFKLYFYFVVSPKEVVKNILKLKISNVNSILKATIWNLTHKSEYENRN